jgi:hypothetical protein
MQRAEVITRLQEMVVANEDGFETLLFDRLCRIARDGAGSACKWTREQLLNQLRCSVRLRVAPSYRNDIAALSEFSSEGLSDITETIADFHVERLELQNEIAECLDRYRLVNITGLPGCGKSAALKHFSTKVARKGPILFLKSDRLVGTGWSTFAAALNLTHSASELLAEIGTNGTPILFIDGIDRIPPDKKGIITDLLTTIEAHEELQHWRILATSRDYGLEPYRAWFPSSFYKEAGIGDVLVKAFSDEEAESLANQRPELRDLLFGSSAIREISRRPFFASILTQDLFIKSSSPKTEIDLINAWWDRAGHDTQVSDRTLRQRALLNLAETGVSRLGKEIPQRKLKENTFMQIGALENDKVIRKDKFGGAYSFTHDIFFEWAFFRLLIDLGDEWPTALSAAGEPPLLGRVVSLLSQSTLSEPGLWTTWYQSLEAKNLRPQWRREWLTAPPFSSSFLNATVEFSALLSTDNELFEKVLVWFQAQHTMPNPIVLQQASVAQSGIEKIRLADLLGWPSDFLGWGRLIDWLISQASSFSMRLIPRAVEIFMVWQNVFADYENPRSAAIIEQCNNWLIELEDRQYSKRQLTQKDKWSELGHVAHSNLITSLRTVILRAARSYPEPARALYARAVEKKQMRRSAYSELMMFTQTMADVDAKAIVAVAKAEIMEELPQNCLDREEREQQEQIEYLSKLRAKPTHELTEQEQRFLHAPHMFMSISSRAPDLDDIGINRCFNYYYPPSALHEPFASLFRLKPDVALAFVNELANHAVEGWRQVHSIDPRMGKPLPVTVEFPWGRQDFWGDWHVYSWSLGQLAPQPLECAFLALSYWAFQEIEKGRSASEVIQEILEGSNCYAMLGIALMLALETFEVSETTLPIASCQRLWHHDLARFINESSRNIDLLGWGALARLSDAQAEAKDFLDGRNYRSREVRHLAMAFALSDNDSLRERFQSALANFPNSLPFEFEEQKSSQGEVSHLTERATAWAELGDRRNYKQSPVEGEKVQISYESPVEMTEEQEQRFQEANAYLTSEHVLVWATDSLSNNRLGDRWSLPDAVRFAQQKDTEELFKVRFEVGAHVDQSMVSAIAACSIAFDPSESKNSEWAWDVMARVMQMDETEHFNVAKVPWHPALHLIATLYRDRRSASPRSDSAERLLRLTAHPIQHVKKEAFRALFLDIDEHISWIAGQRAMDLAFDYQIVVQEGGQLDRSVARRADEKSLESALTKLTGNSAQPFADVPPAWVWGENARRYRKGGGTEENWGDPNPAFDPRFAADIFQLFPIESWSRSEHLRELMRLTLQQLVDWTGERLVPSWREPDERPDRESNLYEWNSVLGSLLARAMPYLDEVWFENNFLQPFLADRDETLTVLSSFVDGLVTRHVMDAEHIHPGALRLLGSCIDRIVRDRQLDPRSYRAGDVSGHELPILIRAVLFVSVDQDCPGAARFANGDWRDSEEVMPHVTRLISAVGWSPYVMGRFLELCERAGSDYPLDAFCTQVSAALEDLWKAKGSWVGTSLPARIAGVIQRLSDTNYPLRSDQAKSLLHTLDTLIDLGDRRSAALEQAEAFRGVQLESSALLHS